MPEFSEHAVKIAERIAPMLTNEDPAIQGAVLINLLASWLANHHQLGPAAMEAIMQECVRTVRRLVGINVAMFEMETKGKH